MHKRILAVLVLSLGLGALVQGDDERILKDNRVPLDGPGLVAFFRERAVGTSDIERLKALVRQLGDDDFATREEASRQLIAIGSRARALLTVAATDSDIEVSRRAQDCLRRIEQENNSVVVPAAARRLAQLRPPGAAAALLEFLPIAEFDAAVEPLHDALAAVALKDGMPDPAILAALTDKSGARRAGAAIALARGAGEAHRPTLRKLLADPEPTVRYRVGLTLASLGEKESIPALIDLIERLNPFERDAVEQLLERLAEEKGPNVLSGIDDAGRKRYVAAWQSWWRDNGANIPPARVAAAARPLGYTLVVLLDENKVVDLDEKNNPRWEIDKLEFPLDVQLLPGERILAAEHRANRVTERNRKNEVLWERKVEGPLAAQRLTNGHTFIATKTQLLEYDATGREVFNHTRPGGEQFMKVTRLRNGQIACVTQVALGAARFLRLDPTGKELQSFPVELHSSGGRIDYLPNGHLLIPEMHGNRVVEHDATGKIVWQAAVEQPIAVLRIGNGNVLVTSMNQKRAVELNRAGQEVWEYRTETRVTRAFRR